MLEWLGCGEIRILDLTTGTPKYLLGPKFLLTGNHVPWVDMLVFLSCEYFRDSHNLAISPVTLPDVQQGSFGRFRYQHLLVRICSSELDCAQRLPIKYDKWRWTMRVYGIQTNPHELFNVGPSTLDPIEITTSGCYLVRRCGVWRDWLMSNDALLLLQRPLATQLNMNITWN
jgi:hypothetical protein